MKARPDVRTAGCTRPNAEDKRADDGILSEGGDSRKDPFESLRAMAALHGHRVHRLDGAGGFVVIDSAGWVSREMRDVHALAQVLRQMGVV